MNCAQLRKSNLTFLASIFLHVKLDQLLEEVPTKAMEAYPSKYLIQPKVTITMLDFSEHGLGEVETNEATVEHRGVRRYIP